MSMNTRIAAAKSHSGQHDLVLPANETEETKSKTCNF